MIKSTNHEKYTTRNPIQQFLLWMFFKSLLSVLSYPKYKTILDAGCGEGFVLSKVKEKFPSVEAAGIDISPDAITIAKQKNPKIKFQVGSVYELPYKNNSFDLVLCNEVLEHLDNPRNAIKELIRVSKKYIVISVPHEPWFMLANFLRGKNILRFGNHPEHIQHWTAYGIIKWVQKHDLKVKKIHIPFFWTIVLCIKK